MPIFDGQPVAAATTNPVYLDKTQDDATLGRLALMNALAASGPTMSNAQREINSIESFCGVVAGSVFNVKPIWANNDVGSSTDDLRTRSDLITAKFNATTGHKHSGAAGDAPRMPPGAIVNTPAAPQDVGAAASVGVGPNFAFEDHVHKGTAGGGGGGSIRWVENANSPTPFTDDNDRVYAFQSGLGQLLYSLIKVPSGYFAGNQIKLKADFYSPDNSGTVLIDSIATLIRQGVDTMQSTTNQRTSTNGAVTLSAGTVNIPQSITLDLTDATGKINGVAVSPGDFIRVAMTRGTDTATSDVNVPVYGSEVSLS